MEPRNDQISPTPDPVSGGAREDIPERFSLVAGGPFHATLGRLGLLEADGLPGFTAALGLALLCWAIPAVAAMSQSLLDPYYTGWEFFRDPTVYARYLVAVLVMVSTERMADGRIVLLIRHFRDAGLLGADGQAQFGRAVAGADRRASSRGTELVILLLAFAWSVLAMRLTTAVSTESWEGMMSATGAVRFSWAGEAALLTSNTVFLFLLLRWSWRFLIWAALLRATAKLNLRLMPLHPDRRGGLGFLAIFPGIFSGLVFALGCVVAAAVIKAMPMVDQIEYGIWVVTGFWLLLNVIVFLGPLVFFIRPLYLAREHALLEYGRLAQEHHIAFHDKWLGEKPAPEPLLGSPDPSSVSDLNASVQTTQEMTTFPVDRNAVVLLLVSAGVPMLVAAAFEMPVADLLKLIVGVVL